ncbi:hypothetical protein NDU88_002333 [Pleurodeles waltl]|uniref:Uncharacterized protein n=1 Tax=Pleurodeles waltl TaxID=8319 RepID=A0AAV7WL42_PLEWA|nr:hypothetical protein NDU88_002333 [Pleurodeles waltl]
MAIEISPRPASAARHPPGPPLRSSSRPSGRKAQELPRSPSRRRPCPPAAGAGTGHAIPPSRSAVPQESRAPWGILPSGASAAIFKPPTFTPNGVADLYRRPRRWSTDRHVRSRRHLGHAPQALVLKTLPKPKSNESLTKVGGQLGVIWMSPPSLRTDTGLWLTQRKQAKTYNPLYQVGKYHTSFSSTYTYRAWQKRRDQSQANLKKGFP